MELLVMEIRWINYHEKNLLIKDIFKCQDIFLKQFTRMAELTRKDKKSFGGGQGGLGGGREDPINTEHHKKLIQ